MSDKDTTEEKGKGGRKPFGADPLLDRLTEPQRRAIEKLPQVETKQALLDALLWFSARLNVPLEKINFKGAPNSYVGLLARDYLDQPKAFRQQVMEILKQALRKDPGEKPPGEEGSGEAAVPADSFDQQVNDRLGELLRKAKGAA